MMKVLFIKPSSLGDVLHAFPALALMRAARPDLTVDWLIHPALAPLLEYQNIRRAIPFDRQALGNPLLFAPAFLRLLRELRQENYDLVLDLQGLFRSAFFARAARSPRVAGFASPRESTAKLFYTERYEIEARHEHAAERNLALAAAAMNISFATPEPTLPVIPHYATGAATILEKHGIQEGDICIGLAPGARWESKRWPPEFFAAVADTLSAQVPQLKFLVLGSGGDRPLADAIREKAQKARIESLAGESSVGELLELIRRSSLLITNDSGPMHIAAALRTPLIAFFGPTTPLRTGPFGSGDCSIFASDTLQCSPCLKKSCPKATLLCQRAFMPADVAGAARMHIDKNR